LTLPDNEWTMAAVVVQPDQAILYLGSVSGGFVSATNSVPHAPEDFTLGPWAIARDINFGDPARFFNGAVDEAAVFTNALPVGFLQSLFYTGIGSNAAPILVTDPPVISPAGAIYAGTPFNLTVDVAGALPLTYQWRTNGIAIPGAAANPYAIASASSKDSGNYTVVVTNAYGAVTSSVATVTILQPVPATITQPPLSQSAYAGWSAAFSVLASGAPAIFTYQWKHEGTNLPGATSQTLVLTGLTSANVGNYTVGVTNLGGGVLSDPATLSLIVPNAYRAAVLADSPLAYYPLDETSGTVAQDFADGYDGSYLNSPLLGDPGATPLTGTAVLFDGVTNSVFIGNPAGLNFTDQITLEAWIKPNAVDGLRNILSHGYSTEVREVMIRIGGGNYQTGVYDNGGLGSANSIMPAEDVGNWVHLVSTYDGTNWNLYRNGILQDAEPSTTGAILVAGSWAIGSRGDINLGDGRIFGGDIDEAAIYDHALTPTRVYAHYALGHYGTTTAPSIVTPPASQTVIAGNTATFSVVPGGSPPFGFQWNSNGVPIAGATSSTLSLPNVYYTYAANYSVTVSGVGAPATSANAALTVVAPPSYANLTNGLVLHLKLDGDLNDSSGHGNNATASGSPAFVAGRIGSNAIYVQSLGTLHDFIQVAYAPDFAFTNNVSWSVAFWVKYTGLPNDLPIICNAINSTYQKGWVLTDDLGKIEYTLVDQDTGAPIIADPVAGSPIIDNGVWHHIVLTVDQAALVAATYVDGVRVNLRLIAGLGNLDTGNNIVVGQDPTGTYGESSNINGSYNVDDIGIWRRALLPFEAESIYLVGRDFNRTFDAIAPVTVDINQVGNFIDLSWQAGTLLKATQVGGPYSPVAGATAPFYRTTASGSAVFFRVQQ
jgi:concanavalin A-like lectin/glucanase superfamily protein